MLLNLARWLSSDAVLFNLVLSVTLYSVKDLHLCGI